MTRAPLSHFAQQIADRDGISLAEAVVLLAADAHIGSCFTPVEVLADRIVVEHDDGSLECAAQFDARNTAPERN